MNLPNEVPHGRPVSDLTQTVNELIRYCRSITPRPSATVGVSTLSNGTTFRVKEGEGGGGRMNIQAQVVGLNQFLVTCVADPEGEEGDFLVSVKGGTAQAMFGHITNVPDVAARSTSIGQDEWCFVCLVYRISYNGNDAHWFEDALYFHVDQDPPENTVNTFYFPIAKITSEGEVLQGHLGAVYLAGPKNIVEIDERA